MKHISELLKEWIDTLPEDVKKKFKEADKKAKEEKEKKNKKVGTIS